MITDLITLRQHANHIRCRDLEIIHRAGLGHAGGDLSSADILTTLYFGVLHIDPANPRDPNRDRFILSKGHGAGLLYTMLAEAGFFPPEQLDTFMAPLSKLNGHPDRNKVPGVETNTGPLGHGFPVGVGAALAANCNTPVGAPLF
jgi:transketolase